MKNLYLNMTRHDVYATEIPLIVFLVISIINNDTADHIMKLYPLIIALSIGIIFIPIYFMRWVRISFDEIRCIGPFSGKDQTLISDNNRLSLTLTEDKRTRIELFGNSKDAVVYEWSKNDAPTEINLFRKKALGGIKIVKRILKHFGVSEADIENAVNADTYSSDYPLFTFNTVTIGEKKEYNLVFKEISNLQTDI